ncbi:transitional endoplasmic reticulum ATPase [Nocardioides zeae]|uniref:Transitional endoplasmic reticulum ATPase n=1 Tax=Nocardioides zeae TaxID=1457234 RepID=A0ACC6IHR5_9ACTN|nr:ATP-binding protein [Nocardioides zeae]MDR6173044.1 transitional endoplasmic reticulum ATPase [Nocardioides zeae]MDR6210037.1 transitional endoplasmic reticulum ATPase [Nocardioides zeae]
MHSEPPDPRPSHPLADLLDGEPAHVRETVAFLGRLLGEAEHRPTPRSFVEQHLGPDPVAVTVDLSFLATPSVAAVLGTTMDAHPHDLGPGDDTQDPAWRRLRLDGSELSVPDNVGVHFRAGTLVDVPVVVRLFEGELYGGYRRQLTVHAPAGGREAAARVVDDLRTRADGEESVFRGRLLRPVVTTEGLTFEVLPLPASSREDLVLDDAVWREVDLNIAAVTTRRATMRALGLASRRGILLAGPPGTGKSALTRQVAHELTGAFTTVVVDARSADDALEEVYAESRRLGPLLVVLEDLDLYAGHRGSSRNPGTLADLLSVLDGTLQLDDVLTVATTNDPRSLDVAAIRSARFDALVEIGYPDRAAATQILRRYVAKVPGAETIDAAAVVDALPADVSGADLREVVRRAALRDGEQLTTASLLTAVREGRWRVAVPVGDYL